MDKYTCPDCGNTKKHWFVRCYDCSEKEKQKPKCEICNVEIQEGHTLCKIHWKEKDEGKRQLQSIDFAKNKTEKEFKQKFEGRYYFNSQKVKSKSELLICYFLSTNGIPFIYEPLMSLEINKEIRPDFVIDDQKGNTIILEHFGMDDENYLAKKAVKEKGYKRLCSKNSSFSFVSTDEDDMFNLKDKLGIKLNKTPLRRAIWK